MNDLKLFLVFIIGIAIGVLIASLLPELLQPYFPEVLKTEREAIEGEITAKQVNQKKILFEHIFMLGAVIL